jgi:conjugal transfer pilus assembly protein TraV
MRKLNLLLFLGIVIAALSSGCSTVGEAINPYSAQFKCEMTENGRCTSMTGAYLGSLQKDPGNGRNGKNGKVLNGKNTNNAVDPPVSAASETAYQEALFKKLSGLLEEPTTPVIAPPKVMRVFLLPYKAEKDLFMYRYVYFVVDDYSWVLGDDVLGGK